jgi:hypothetical protein
MRVWRITLLFFALCSFDSLRAQEPQVSSVFPSGGQQGSTVKTEIRGQNLKGAYAVWFDCEKIKASVAAAEDLPSVEKEPNPKHQKKPSAQHVILEVTLSPTAGVGVHQFRVVSPKGESGPLTFRVNREPQILESRTLHNTPAEAQKVGYPAVVNGAIGEKGEIDYYEINVAKTEELQFEVLTDFCDLQMMLYETSGSWFDPQRPRRLEFDDESIFYTFPYPKGSCYLPRLARRFDKPGKCLVQIGTLEGQGASGHAHREDLEQKECRVFLFYAARLSWR